MAGLWEPVCGVYSSTYSVLPCLQSLIDFGNSSFFTTAFGALAGAFAGAWAAQRIAVKNKLQDEISKEVRSTNSALLLGQAIFNIAIACKRDCSLPLKKGFSEDLEVFSKYGDEFGQNLNRPINLEGYTISVMPIQELSSLVLTEISSSTKAVRALIHLQMAIDRYHKAQSQRHDLIRVFQSETFPKSLRFQDMYFGETYKGITDTSYRNNIESIGTSTDDMIFYCSKMCDYLYEHVVELKDQYRKITKTTIKINKLGYSPSFDLSLIPKDELYAEWLAGHKTVKNPLRKRWWQLINTHN